MSLNVMFALYIILAYVCTYVPNLCIRSIELKYSKFCMNIVIYKNSVIDIRQ